MAWAGLVTVLVCLDAVAPATPPGHTGACLQVAVGPVRSAAGAILCALFDQPRDFPGTCGAGARARLRVPAQLPWTACTFCGLSPGVYAVVAVHDENDNGALDTGFLGIPIEGWAVSGTRRRRFKAPLFVDSCFLFDDPKGQKLSLQLRY